MAHKHSNPAPNSPPRQFSLLQLFRFVTLLAVLMGAGVTLGPVALCFVICATIGGVAGAIAGDASTGLFCGLIGFVLGAMAAGV